MPTKSWSKGATKAYAAMVKRYGKTAGQRIFFAKSNKVNKSKSLSPGQKASKVYKTHGTQKTRKIGKKK
jgi:hypothetical protein